ncbi:hypothetical protein SOVF_149700, partial [Spinacia oleracea]
KKKISATKVVVAIVVPLAVLGMIFAITIYLFKKKSKRYPSQDVRNVLDDLNTAEHHLSGVGDLLTHAWRSFTEENPSAFMDPTLKSSYVNEEVVRCIHLGLSCAQENTNARPTMSTVVLVLNCDSTTSTLSTPQCPRSFYSSSADSSVVSRLSVPSSMTTTSTNE